MTTTKMKAIVQTNSQERRSLELREVDVPQLRPGEVLVKVQAAGVNRGDILQTMGAYPPPPGASKILGLEAAGTIADAGDTNWEVGTEVGCLLAGGGYARIRCGSAGPAASRAQGVERRGNCSGG